MQEYIDKYEIDPVNRQYLSDYIHHYQLVGVSRYTIINKIDKLHVFFREMNFKDSMEVTGKEIEEYYLNKRQTLREKTAHNHFIEVRLFFRWLRPEEPQLISFKPKKPTYTPHDKIISHEDIKALLRTCHNPRDRAIIMVLWDSGCRLGELVGLNIRDIKFDNYGAQVHVTGKTGTRPVRLVDAVPYIQDWLRLYPVKDHLGNAKKDAPLFCTSLRYKGEYRRLTDHRIQMMLKQLAKEANVSSNIHPHAFRHTRATEFSKQLPETALRKVFGWTASSNMPEVYVHLSGRDVDECVLKMHGLLDEEMVDENGLSVWKCPRCETLNAVDDGMCRKCGLIVDRSISEEIDQQKVNMSQMLTQMMKSPEFVELLSKYSQQG